VTESVGPRLNRVRITVVAAATHPDVLSVQDAMRQVLDFFDLLTPEDDETFIWNLKMATTNSPLTVEGEAYSTSPSVNASALAAEQAVVIEDSFRSLSEGRVPTRRLSTRRRETIRRILKRNMNGIGKTEAIMATLNPVSVTPTIAEVSVRALELSEFDSLVLTDRAREEIGSIEGTLIEVGKDYNQPSVIVRERRTGAEISCRVSDELRQAISASTTLDDVWSNRRVLVRGRIRYNSDGSVHRVMRTDSIRPVAPHDIPISNIVDADFTSGMSVPDYLDKLREGELG
jgi:hypothetical protein